MDDYTLSRIGKASPEDDQPSKLGREVLTMDREELEQAAADEAKKLNLTLEEAMDAYEAGALPTDAKRFRAILGFLQPAYRADVEPPFECLG